MIFKHCECVDFWRENSNLASICSIQLRIIGDEASANRESSFGATVSDEQDIILILIRKIIHFSGSQLMIMMITELESGFAYLAKASSGGKHSIARVAYRIFLRFRIFRVGTENCIS